MISQPINYLFLFLVALALSAGSVPILKKGAFRIGLLDIPKSPRKIHTAPIPLIGGFAIFIASALTALLYIFYTHPDLDIIPIRFYFGIFIGAVILLLGGYFDDRYDLSPNKQVIFPVAAALAVVFSGIGVGINVISNPFGTPFSLQYSVFGIPLAGIFTFIFVLGMIYTTKFLDGMDGLAGGISFIASLTLFFLSLSDKVNQPITASLAIIFCGALLGFLIYNFNPASIFLGEGGSTMLGFILGVFSVLLGAKIATALLVMGLPVLDVAWVILRRIYYRHSPFQADRKHLHFRLLDIGFSQRQTVIILYCLAIIFGVTALVLQTRGKLFALLILFVIMIALGLFTVMAFKHQHPHIPGEDPVIDEKA